MLVVKICHELNRKQTPTAMIYYSASLRYRKSVRRTPPSIPELENDVPLQTPIFPEPILDSSYRIRAEVVVLESARLP